MEEYTLSILLLVIIFLFCYLIWQNFKNYEKKKYNLLYRSGNKVSARVSKVSYYILRSSPGILQVTIDYIFQDEVGKEFKGYGQFQDEKFKGAQNEIKKGDFVNIYFLPKEPSVNALEEIVLRKTSI